jgi:hypothetical protein
VQNRYGRALICGGLAVLFLGVMVLIARESADLKLRLFDGLIWASVWQLGRRSSTGHRS